MHASVRRDGAVSPSRTQRAYRPCRDQDRPSNCHAGRRISGARHPWSASPSGTSFSIHLHVANVDKAFEQAVDAGAAVVRPLKDQFYGERSGTVRDPFGHEWLLGGHLETVTPQEMQRRYTEMTMARDAMLAIAWVTAPGPLRPILESFSALAVPIIATKASIVGFVGARRLARVVDVDVPIFDLPIAFTDLPSSRSATFTSDRRSSVPTSMPSSTRSTACAPISLR